MTRGPLVASQANGRRGGGLRPLAFSATLGAQQEMKGITYLSTDGKEREVQREGRLSRRLAIVDS